MAKKAKQSFTKNVIEFIKLQLAGNVLFWVTYLGTAFFDLVLGQPNWRALVMAAVIANTLFFIINRDWVFNDEDNKRKNTGEAVRFAIFMGFNFFLNLGMILALEEYFDISPYIGQFLVGVFFAIWSWLGLKFWVFRHARHAHHHALTIETRKSNAKRHTKYKQLAAKQKAKRTA
jgi:putative flippase GtrA